MPPMAPDGQAHASGPPCSVKLHADAQSHARANLLR